MKEVQDKEGFQRQVRNKLDGRGLIKTTIVSLFVFGSLAFVIYAGLNFYYKVIHSDESITPTNLDNSKEGDSYSADTDGDGLPDWQEDLYGSSKSLIDTDGDTVSDFDEVQSGTDPGQFGEGEDQEIIITPPKTLFGTTTLEIIVPQQVDNGDPTSESISSQELLNKESKQHLNAVGKVINQYPVTREEDYFIFEVLIKKQGTPDKVRLLEIAENYKRVSENIPTTNVPTELATFNSGLQSGYQKTGESIEKILELYGNSTDEEYNAALMSYSVESFKLFKTIMAISNFIQSREIKFQPHEPGYILSN